MQSITVKDSYVDRVTFDALAATDGRTLLSIITVNWPNQADERAVVTMLAGAEIQALKDFLNSVEVQA